MFYSCELCITICKSADCSFACFKIKKKIESNGKTFWNKQLNAKSEKKMCAHRKIIVGMCVFVCLQVENIVWMQKTFATRKVVVMAGSECVKCVGWWRFSFSFRLGFAAYFRQTHSRSHLRDKGKERTRRTATKQKRQQRNQIDSSHPSS